MSEVSIAVAQSIAVPGDLVRSVDDHIRLAKCAADRGARLVLFPELSLTGYDRRLTPADALMTTDPRLQPLQALADEREILVIAGAPIVSEGGLGVAGRLCARASNDGLDGQLWGSDKRMALGRAQCDMVKHRGAVGLWSS